MQDQHPKGPQDGGRKAAGDVMFSVLERVVSQLAQFAVFIVAARLLGPTEFGIFALASACAMLLLKAAEAGWAPFIMSRSGDITVPLQVLFIAIVSGTLFGTAGGLFVLVAGGSLGLAPDTVSLMLCFALWVALANAASAQKGVLIWLGRIKTAAACEIAGELVALGVAVFALLNGAGVFALIYGRLAAQSSALVFSFAATRRAPLPGLPPSVQRELWVFSGQIFTSRMLVQVRLQFVTLIIGGFLGPAAVGFFRAAERLVGAISELIVVPGQLMAWTLLRRARDAGAFEDRKDRINTQVARLLKVLVVLGAPLLLWLIVMNEEIVRGLLGDEWLPTATLVGILAFGRLFLFLGVLTEPLMSIAGEARRLTAFMALIFAVSVLLTLIAAPFGIYALAWSQTAVCAIVMGASIRLFGRHGGIDWAVVARSLRSTVLPLACGTATIWMLDLAAKGRGLPDLVAAAGFGLAGGVVLAGVMAVMDPDFRVQVMAILRPAPQQGRAPQ